MPVRNCKDCGVENTPKTFYRSPKNLSNPYCKKCTQKRCTQWNKMNKDKRKVISRRNTLKKYGITVEEYGRIFTEQDGKCAVCLALPETCTQKVLCVDHDHKNGWHRGLLCDRCNRALGLLKDSPTIIEALLRYTQGHLCR